MVKLYPPDVTQINTEYEEIVNVMRAENAILFIKKRRCAYTGFYKTEGKGFEPSHRDHRPSAFRVRPLTTSWVTLRMALP